MLASILPLLVMALLLFLYITFTSESNWSKNDVGEETVYKNKLVTSIFFYIEPNNSEIKKKGKKQYSLLLNLKL